MTGAGFVGLNPGGTQPDHAKGSLIHPAVACQPVVGAQPHEMLVQLMEAAGARPRGDGGGSQSDSS